MGTAIKHPVPDRG